MSARNGEQYLVAMLGQNTNWVRNVRAAEGRVVLRHGKREAVLLEETNPTLLTRRRPRVARARLAHRVWERA